MEEDDEVEEEEEEMPVEKQMALTTKGNHLDERGNGGS